MYRSAAYWAFDGRLVRGCTSMSTSLAFPTGMLELWRYNTWGVPVCQPVWHSLQVCWNYEDTILGVYQYVNQSGIPYRYVGTMKVQYLGCTSMSTSLAFPTGMLELWRYNTWGVPVCQPVWHSLQVCWNYEDTILGVYQYVNQSGIPYRYVGTMKIQYLGCTSMSTSLAFPTGMLELWRYNTWGVPVCQPVWHSLQVCWNYEDTILGGTSTPTSLAFPTGMLELWRYNTWGYKYSNQSGIPYRYVGTMKIQYLGCTSMPTSLAFPTGMLELWRYNTWGVQVCQPVWHSLQVCWNYDETLTLQIGVLFPKKLVLFGSTRLWDFEQIHPIRFLFGLYVYYAENIKHFWIYLEVKRSRRNRNLTRPT